MAPPVAGLGEQDEKSLVGVWGLFRICWAAHVLKRWFSARKFGPVRKNFRRNLSEHLPFSMREEIPSVQVSARIQTRDSA